MGAEARQGVQKAGGAVRWLRSVSAHLLLHPAAGVGDEAVSLQAQGPKKVAPKPSSKQAPSATQAKIVKGTAASKASPAAAAASMDEQVLVAGVRILHGAETPMRLSPFFQELYREQGAEARQVVQKAGGAVRWLRSVSAHLLLHPAAGVGDEAVSLQARGPKKAAPKPSSKQAPSATQAKIVKGTAASKASPAA